jgi:hypothetical protein
MNAEEILLENGYDPKEIVVFKNEDYETALIGVSDDCRAVYDFNLMIEYLMNKYGWSDIESIEWIETNTLRAIPYKYKGRPAPIVMYKFID